MCDSNYQVFSSEKLVAGRVLLNYQIGSSPARGPAKAFDSRKSLSFLTNEGDLKVAYEESQSSGAIRVDDLVSIDSSQGGRPESVLYHLDFMVVRFSNNTARAYRFDWATRTLTFEPGSELSFGQNQNEGIFQFLKEEENAITFVRSPNWDSSNEFVLHQLKVERTGDLVSGFQWEVIG